MQKKTNNRYINVAKNIKKLWMSFAISKDIAETPYLKAGVIHE